MYLPTLQGKIEEGVFNALVLGDLSKLNLPQKTQLYKAICESLGLNPATKPFEYINFRGKELLYAGKNCCEQLRGLHKLSITIADRQKIESLYIVTARATTPDGRTDESQGAVDLANLSGESLSNAIMKCETKAKRRVTLSILGLGMLDDTEIDDSGALRKSEIEAPPARMIEWLYNLEAVPEEKRRDAVEYCRQNGATWNDDRYCYVSNKRLARLDAYQIKTQEAA